MGVRAPGPGLSGGGTRRGANATPRAAISPGRERNRSSETRGRHGGGPEGKAPPGGRREPREKRAGFGREVNSWRFAGAFAPRWPQVDAVAVGPDERHAAHVGGAAMGAGRRPGGCGRQLRRGRLRLFPAAGRGDRGARLRDERAAGVVGEQSVVAHLGEAARQQMPEIPKKGRVLSIMFYKMDRLAGDKY